MGWGGWGLESPDAGLLRVRVLGGVEQALRVRMLAGEGREV